MSDVTSSKLRFPDDMFELRPGETPMYGFEPELHAGVEFFKSLISADEWKTRRLATAKWFYQSLVGEAMDPTGKGHFYAQDDKFAWYVFLGEAFNHHPPNYEPIFGCKVVPVLASIGHNIHLIDKIEGFEERSRRLWGDEKQQPNGTLFELLVALAYAREGHCVRFVPETPGRAKSHDLEVEIDGTLFAVECKRLEAGEFDESERQRMRELWHDPARLIVPSRRSVFLNIDFRVPLADVSDTYLLNKTTAFLNSAAEKQTWSDDVSSGSLSQLDLAPIKTALVKGYMLYPGAVYNKALFGEYVRNDNLIQLQRVKPAPNPHFIDDVEQVIAARWRSKSEISIDRKARDIKRVLVKAHKQLPEDKPSIIHVGIESLGGDETEKRRYYKIRNVIDKFDMQSKPVVFIYCNYFAPEAPAEEAWAIDETVHWHARVPGWTPLRSGNLIVPEEADFRDGMFWDGKPTPTFKFEDEADS
ncbi:transposase [Roseibium aggregatum]|uniref:transposase n=1 Tax=Roseibium aggregatum TaxID=187304 RepID=UPI001E2F2B61|nr:transposase [Roseibium aggregatum]UES44298.1 transposase [Roseibium aggregatum]